MSDKQGQTIELDVRPYLKQKLEPFQVIMDAVKNLKKEDTFILHATFKPTPLLKVLRLKGYVNKAEQIENDHWIVTFVHKSRASELEIDPDDEDTQSDTDSTLHQHQEAKVYELDNRGLEPPQPMKRTLKKLSEANVGDTVIIHNDRVPVFLIEELDSLGYEYTIENQEDGSAKVRIRKV